MLSIILATKRISLTGLNLIMTQIWNAYEISHSNTHICQWTRSALQGCQPTETYFSNNLPLVLVFIWFLFATKPICEVMLSYCQLHPLVPIPVKSVLTCKNWDPYCSGFKVILPTHSERLTRQLLVGCSRTVLRNGAPWKPSWRNGVSNSTWPLDRVSTFSVKPLKADFSFWRISRSAWINIKNS